MPEKMNRRKAVVAGVGLVALSAEAVQAHEEKPAKKLQADPLGERRPYNYLNHFVVTLEHPKFAVGSRMECKLVLQNDNGVPLSKEIDFGPFSDPKQHGPNNRRVSRVFLVPDKKTFETALLPNGKPTDGTVPTSGCLTVTITDNSGDPPAITPILVEQADMTF